MYPTALTQLARANPFSAPLFSLQEAEEPEKHAPVQKRGLAAAAVAGKTVGHTYMSVGDQKHCNPSRFLRLLLYWFLMWLSRRSGWDYTASTMNKRLEY